MNIVIQKSKSSLGKEAGKMAANILRQTIQQKGSANIILATGSSQFETLNQLIIESGIDWGKVMMFHLDEYINLPIEHKASFRKYLQDRFISRVSPLKSVNFINGETQPEQECKRLAEIIKKNPIDLALVGIGENGHLAFNDPPADFETNDPYLIANLDHTCRQQQVNEKWFGSIEEVPLRAISMSIKQVMKSKYIICSVPGLRKAQAVKDSLEGPVTNMHPASILQSHSNCYLFLDNDSATLLSNKEK